MKQIITTGLISIFLFIFFLLFTFPYSRLGPKIEEAMEESMYNMWRIRADCSLDNLSLAFPLGAKWSSMDCRTRDTQLFKIDNGSLRIFPGQRIGGEIGSGSMIIRKSGSRITGDFQKIPLTEMSPLLMTIINSMQPNVPKDLKLEGLLMGSFDIPLNKFKKANGNLNLRIDALKLPKQPVLDLIGLQELTFNKSSLKADLKEGKLAIQDIDFRSEHLSGKMEGNLTLEDDVNKSSGSMTLKWKVAKSDAILSSPLGAVLSATPCPRPDPDGYCSKRITRLSDLLR